MMIKKKIVVSLVSAALLVSFLFAQTVFAAGHTWNFSTDSDYNYDSNKITVSGGQAKLKATASPDWYNDQWSYRKKITIDSTKVPASLSNFPVLIQSTDADWKDTSNGGSVALANGNDIVFTNADGTTILPYEIEKYNSSSGELVAWVNVPSLSASVDTELYIYYGNSSATNLQNAAGVWDSNYKMVQHAKGSGQMDESTSNGNSGTITGDPFDSYSITSVSPHTTAHQGVATDGTNFYTFDTDAIAKWDATWTKTNELLNANQSIGVNTTNHLSDGEYYNGKLYSPVENYVHPCVSSSDNYLAIWNASDLSFDSKIDLSGLGFSSAGLTIDPDAGDNGIIYNISYCDGTKIWKLDLSTGAYLGAIDLSQTIPNSQGITMKNGFFYIVDDLNDIVWKVDQDGTVLHSVFSYPHVASGSLEGVDYSTDNLLILIDQGVPDRKVYTLEHTGPTKIGNALDFKKTESISIPYQLPDNGTISLWYNPKNYFYNFHSLLDNSVSDNDWEMWVDSTGYVNFRVKNGEVAVKYDLGDNVTQVGLNTWFHIVIKWQKGGNKSLLVNGVQRGTNSIASTWVNPGASTYIGGGNVGNTKDNGYFDEIRISDVVRSNNWLLAEYNNQNSPGTFYSVGAQTSPTFDATDPTIEAVDSFSFSSALAGFTESSTKNGGEIKYQLSNDDGSTWYWWNGSSWTTTISGYSESNTASEVDAHIAVFPIGAGLLNFKAFLHSNGSQLVKLDTIDIIDDATPPVTSSVATTSSNTSVTVSWSTDEHASSQIEYGVTASYGSATTEINTSTRVLSHSDSITGLLPCTVYHFRVRSTDAASNTGTSSDGTFATAGCSGTASITQNSTTPITLVTGGTASLSSGTANLVLDIPANATGVAVAYQIKQLAGSSVITETGSPSDMNPSLTHIYDLKALSAVNAEETSLDEPVTVTITYQDGDIAGLIESSLLIYHHDGSSWSPLSSCNLNPSSNTISCLTSSFSVFGLFGQASAQTASSSTAEKSSNGPASCNAQPPGNKAPWLYAGLTQDAQSILLYFTPADEPVSAYVLEYGTKSGQYQFGVQDLGINSRDQMTYLVKSLAPNTTYYFRIRAGNDCATGPWSNELSAKTNGLISFNQLEFLNSKLVPTEQTHNEIACENYTVLPGDNLWSIAQNKLGNGAKFDQIIKQNVTKYPSLTNSNNLEIGWELQLGCSGGQTSEEDDNEQGQSSEQVGYTLSVRVVDTDKKPIGGAKVTIHSKVQEAITNEEGIAEFHDVEPGSHRVIIAHQRFQGEQSLDLSGDVKAFALDIEVHPKPFELSLFAYVIISVLVFTIIVLLWRLKRKAG